jgi:hypothetical protein
VATYKDLRGQEILCRADDEDGTLTVPASLMEDLDDPFDTLGISVTRYAASRVTVQGKDVDFEANTYRQRNVYGQ